MIAIVLFGLFAVFVPIIPVLLSCPAVCVQGGYCGGPCEYQYLSLTRSFFGIGGDYSGVRYNFDQPWYNPINVETIRITVTGTFQIVYPPCPAGVQCGPQYQLAGDDGNSYQLSFNTFASTSEECPVGSCVPTQGQHIRVTGTIVYNTMAQCSLNGQSVPCQPIGTITVSSWSSA
jgi:hypothetical protein